MSDSHWFFVEQIPSVGVEFALSDSEAGHAIRARRLRLEDHLTLFDGKGQLADAAITGINQKPLEVRVRVDSGRVVDRPRPDVHLFSALPKGDRQATMIDMLTQVGVGRFTPLHCARSVSQAKPQHYQRWVRLAIEAAKQSHRAWLPELTPPVRLDEWVGGIDPQQPVVVADASGACLRDWFDDPAGMPKTVCLVVGPEGGLNNDERKMLEKGGAQFLSLGHHVLRVETAAVALTALIRSVYL
ncbi:MAG: RsmE family RNA methyltransferase [Gammaproteobacteria bacterium]